MYLHVHVHVIEIYKVSLMFTYEAHIVAIILIFYEFFFFFPIVEFPSTVRLKLLDKLSNIE